MKKTLLCVLAAFSVSALAGQDCPGKVSEIMDHSTTSSLCGERVAFRLDSTGSTYLCAISEQSDAMVLAAYMAGKTISPRLNPPTPGDCQSYSSNYITPAYIRILD